MAEVFDLAVVGAGPAGLAGAARAAECGLRVALLDDNPEPGGQIWRRETSKAGSRAMAWAERARHPGVTLMAGARVFDAPEPGVLASESAAGGARVAYSKLLIATGARERYLPFPGWTLPHVFGAGGLQAMVKNGLPIAGKRVVVAGSGPLLMAVAAYLRGHGAILAALCEQAPALAMARFGAAALMQPGMLAQAVALQRQIGMTPVWPGAWPVATAEGVVEIARGARRVRVECDYLACGFHLVPNLELAQLLGCATQAGAVVVNARQETTVAGVSCAGEPTGIGGVDLALLEGEIAGFHAAGEPAKAEALYAARARKRDFANLMEATFAPRAELRGLPQPDTIVCRCEDVSWQRAQSHPDLRSAKLQTRCGMGACQGRVCGAALEFLCGWEPALPRPPFFPAAVALIAAD